MLSMADCDNAVSLGDVWVLAAGLSIEVEGLRFRIQGVVGTMKGSFRWGGAGIT